MTLVPKAAFDKVPATEYNELLRLAQPLFVRSAGSDSTALTTFKTHPTLTLTPDINATYTFTAWIVANAPAAQDLKFQWITPSSAAGWWTVKNQTTAGAAETAWQNNLTWASNVAMEGSAVDKVFEIFGVLRTAGVAGALTLQYAANAAGTVTILADSTMELRKR